MREYDYTAVTCVPSVGHGFVNEGESWAEFSLNY